MQNPKLPGVNAQQEALLFRKLHEYNQGKSSFKEAGAYIVALPRDNHPAYTLWLYSPTVERQVLLYLHDLSPDINQSLRTVSTWFYYSRRGIFVVPYNEKRMRSNGDDLIGFGKYRGHFLYEILKIDPAYVGWISYKFTPKIPKQKRFVKIAQAYYSVHLDLLARQSKEKRHVSRYLGELGEKVCELNVRVRHVRTEDDPYKTRVWNGKAIFFPKQILTANDAEGNLIRIIIPSAHASLASGVLSELEHAYQAGELIRIRSARISRKYEYHGRKYTCLSHVRLAPGNPAERQEAE